MDSPATCSHWYKKPISYHVNCTKKTISYYELHQDIAGKLSMGFFIELWFCGLQIKALGKGKKILDWWKIICKWSFCAGYGPLDAVDPQDFHLQEWWFLSYRLFLLLSIMFCQDTLNVSYRQKQWISNWTVKYVWSHCWSIFMLLF